MDALDITRSLVRQVISAYWKETEAPLGGQAKLREFPSDISLVPLEPELRDLAEKMGTKAAELDVLDASYRIGVLYTGLMPDERRARLGAHYTPQALCQRLLDMAEEAGVKWDTARVLDPACGGGAFLSPIS
ncbi:MAG: SAM-dependent methyltransferase, partial [Gammaproteobacteria bacterium]|nr:SAM-dependent methyltransferase [Gammaproteobacteria bacterium]